MKPIREILENFSFKDWLDIIKYFTQTVEGCKYCINERKGLFALDPISNDIYPVIEYLKSRYCISEIISFKNIAGKEQYFFELKNGSNGRFGNCTFDMKETKDILEYLNYGPGKEVIDWANLYLYSGDMVDDIYSWIITFTHV